MLILKLIESVVILVDFVLVDICDVFEVFELEVKEWDKVCDCKYYLFLLLFYFFFV